MPGLLSQRVLGCRAEDAAADAHRDRILELQRGALRARARAMYTTAGDWRDANFAIASVLAERFRAHQAKKAG